MADIKNATFIFPSTAPIGTPQLLSTSSFTTIHTVSASPSGKMDEVYVWVNNPTAATIVAEVRCGGVSSTTIMKISIPAYTTYVVVNGLRLGYGTDGTIAVKAQNCVVYCNVNALLN